MVVLHLGQRHTGLRGQAGKLVQIRSIQRERAWGQALEHPRMGEVAFDQRGVGRGGGREGFDNR